MARSKKTTVSAANARKNIEVNKSRDLFLAGVGAVALGRKKAIAGFEDAKQNVIDLRAYVNNSVKNSGKNAKKLRKQAEGKFNALNKQAKTEISKIQKQFKAKVAPIQKQVLAVVNEAKAQAESRLAPVFAKFGKKVGPKAKKASVAKKPAAKRVVKRAAKRVAKTARRKAA
jgi:hypothetical protein